MHGCKWTFEICITKLEAVMLAWEAAGGKMTYTLPLAKFTGLDCSTDVRFMQAVTAYRWAAWLYHYADKRWPSPMTDGQFDELGRALGMDKTAGHQVILHPWEKALARAWSERN